MVEYRPILFVNIVSQFQSSTFGHNYPTLQRGLSEIAELLVNFGMIRMIGFDGLCEGLHSFFCALACYM